MFFEQRLNEVNPYSFPLLASFCLVLLVSLSIDVCVFHYIKPPRFCVCALLLLCSNVSVPFHVHSLSLVFVFSISPRSLYRKSLNRNDSICMGKYVCMCVCMCQKMGDGMNEWGLGVCPPPLFSLLALLVQIL